MTTVYFVRHAEPDFNNHDDMTRGLSARGLKDRKLVTDFYGTKRLMLFYQVRLKEPWTPSGNLPKPKGWK